MKILLLGSLFFLAGCGVSNEESYEAGYEDAVGDICQEVRDISREVESKVRSCN